MSLEVNTILFAIRAGIQLYGAGLKAHADATKAEVLVLPLPKAGLPSSGAENWLLSPAGIQARQETDSERIEFLLFLDRRTDAQEAELQEIVRVLRPLVGDEVEQPADQAWSAEEIGAVLTIGQWSLEAPADNAPPIQTVAGTLVNLAVDYFVSTPGAVNAERPQGRAIQAFLEAISGTDFSRATLPGIAPGLFVALLDSVSANPGLIAGGPKEKLFVTEVTKSLSEVMTTALKDKTASERKAFFDAHWPELIARAFFAGGAETILAHPTTYLGAKAGAEANIVKTLVTTFTELTLTETGLDFGSALSQAGMEQILEAALSAVADNPDVLDLGAGGEGVEKLILQTLAGLAAREQLLAADLAPQLAALVLRGTAENLALILRHDGKDPKKNLIIVASGVLLDALADNATKRWDPPLTQAQVLALLETVVAEVLKKPDWLASDLLGAGSGSVLRVALDAALASLRENAVPELDNPTLMRMLQAALAAVADNLTLVREVSGDGPTGERIALRQVFDLVLISLRDIPASATETRWRLANAAAASALLEIALRALARQDASPAHLDILREEINKVIAGPTRLDDLPDILEQRFAAA